MKKILLTILPGIIGGALAFGLLRYFDKNSGQNAQNASESTRTSYKLVNYAENPAPFDFTRAAEKAMPAVVHIKASESRKASQNQRQSHPFQFFFGEDFLNGFENFNQPRSGTGSGVIYTADGYILTNNHVIEFADEFEVTLHDNRAFKARLVGKDPNSDMAVIKIEAQDLPYMELSNSDDVKVGEWVLAVGNPFDLTSTVTAGIVSAKGRDIGIIKGRSSIEAFIQTDAAVNPGNSGGALVDLQGRLIGINSAIASPTGAFAGYSFAIPVNLVKKIADDLIKYGVFKRAYLGVDIVDMNAELAKELNVSLVNGVYVDNLDEEGSAYRSGIKPGDIITQIAGHRTNTIPELQEQVGKAKVGETLNVTVFRNGKQLDIPVKLRSKSNG